MYSMNSVISSHAGDEKQSWNIVVEEKLEVLRRKKVLLQSEFHIALYNVTSAVVSDHERLTIDEQMQDLIEIQRECLTVMNCMSRLVAM